MNQAISKAVRERRVLSFRYKGVFRTAEPHAFGRQKSGGDGLCAWQLSGGSGEGFRLFLTSEMSVLTADDPDTFEVRPGYHRGDQRFAVIYVEL